MTKFITLKQITDETPAFQEDAPDTEGEDDGIVQLPGTTSARDERIDWKPNTINVDAIRNFYPRKGGRVGSRVLMKTGVAYVVADTHDEIMDKIRAA